MSDAEWGAQTRDLRALSEVAGELARIRRRHGCRPFSSAHEAYGVLRDEVEDVGPVEEVLGGQG